MDQMDFAADEQTSAGANTEGPGRCRRGRQPLRHLICEGGAGPLISPLEACNCQAMGVFDQAADRYGMNAQPVPARGRFESMGDSPPASYCRELARGDR
jgi:hypothetical protein